MKPPEAPHDGESKQPESLKIGNHAAYLRDAKSIPKHLKHSFVVLNIPYKKRNNTTTTISKIVTTTCVVSSRPDRWFAS